MKMFGLGKLADIGTAITNKMGRAGLVLQKAAPDILVVAGIAGVVGATVIACTRTKELDDILDEHAEELNAIKTEHEVEAEAEENGESTECPSDASERSYRASITQTYIHTGIKVIRLYGPCVALYGVSVACILKSHNILKQRNLAMCAAYEAVDSAFKKYRKNVVEKYGENEDRAMRFGQEIVAETVYGEDPETGEEMTETVYKEVYDIPEGCNENYGFWFDKETCPYVFDGDPVHDLALACGIEANFDVQLQTKGHVILHELTDQFGRLERRTADIVAGWVVGNGDGHIDLGLRTADGAYRKLFARDELGRVILVDPNDPEERQYLRNGFWIEPNVDGIIFDKI